MYSTAGARAAIKARAVQWTPPLAHALRLPVGDIAMYSTAGARAASKARAAAVNSTTAARAAITCRRWCDVLHRWRTCCTHLQEMVR